MDEKTLQEKAQKVLRNYLIRCHKTVSDDYPEIANMPPEKAADYLIHLKNSGRIKITLDAVGSQIKCQIEDMGKHR